MLELLPPVSQPVPGDDLLEACMVEDTRFNELQEACFVFGASSLESNGREVLSSEDAGCRPLDIHLPRRSQCFFKQRARGRKKLNWPTANHDVFAFHRAVTILKIAEDGFRADNRRTWLGPKLDEDIHIESRDRLQIEGGANGAANGITINDAIGPPLIDRAENFFYFHGAIFEARP